MQQRPWELGPQKMPWGTACVPPSWTVKGQRWRQSPWLCHGGKDSWCGYLPLPYLLPRFGETMMGTTRPQLLPTSEAMGMLAGIYSRNAFHKGQQGKASQQLSIQWRSWNQDGEMQDEITTCRAPAM